MQKVCEICGREYAANSNNAKYCNYCKDIAAKLTRRKWEQKTNFKDKKNQKQNAQRAAARTQREQEQAQDTTEKERERAAAAAEFEKNRRAELEQRAANGDKWAAAQLAIMDKDFYTYWQLRAEMEQEQAEQTGRYFKNTVGGISLYEPDFAKLMLYEMTQKREHPEQSDKEP